MQSFLQEMERRMITSVYRLAGDRCNIRRFRKGYENACLEGGGSIVTQMMFDRIGRTSQVSNPSRTAPH